MGRAKEDWIEKTGGFRLGEGPADFKARVARIEELERQMVSPKLSMAEREKVQRELCSLKGIDFDSYDGDDD